MLKNKLTKAQINVLEMQTKGSYFTLHQNTKVDQTVLQGENCFWKERKSMGTVFDLTSVVTKGIKVLSHMLLAEWWKRFCRS